MFEGKTLSAVSLLNWTNPPPPPPFSNGSILYSILDERLGCIL